MKQFLKALQNIGVNENYISIIKDIYTDATARIHINEQVSEEIKILKGVRQGDPLSPKLLQQQSKMPLEK